MLAPLFSGCQITLDQSEYYDPGPVSDPIGKLNDSQREKAALAVIVPIYPNDTDERPVSNGKSPFGVLIGFGKPGFMSYCSVSHVLKGVVLTATHCITAGSVAGDYYFLYFNKAGQKKITRGTSFQFSGNADQGDVTLIRVDNRSAEWDTLDYTMEDTSTERDLEIGQVSHPVTLWSFDPSQRGTDRLMSFRPRKCILGRTAPHITIGYNDGTEGKKEYKDKYNSRYWQFFDECDSPTIQGNSGGLISERDNYSRVHGVLHGTVYLTPSAGSTVATMDMVMPSGTKRRLIFGSQNELFNLAAPLDYINWVKPGTL